MDEERTKAVHDLANVLYAIAGAVAYLGSGSCQLPGETKEVVSDLKLCVDRFPALLARLRGQGGR